MTQAPTLPEKRSAARSSRVGWRGRLGLLLFGLILSLAAVEAVLRLLGPHLPVINSLTSIATFQTYHPIYGFFHRPGASGWIETPEYTSFVSINARGLRDHDIDPAKPPGGFRVLMLGDSFVEGAQVPLDATVAKRLEDSLRASLPGSVDVVNAGNAGFGTGQELLFLQHEGVGYRPDVVVLVYFIDNDLPDNGYAVARARDLDTSRRPFFVPDGHGGLELRPGLEPPPDRLAGLKTTLRQSFTYNLFENFLLWNEARAQEQAQIGKNRPTYLVDPPDEWDEAWWVTERLLVQARDTSQEAGADFLLVLAPSYFQVDERAWRWLVEADTRNRRYDQQAPNRRLAQIAARDGLRILDLLPAIRAATAAGAHLYYPADGHWTTEGHALAAREIEGRLEADRLTPSR
ncbi:MAG: SGNH/GDSL hydrolase family protein [Chloroflexi bacterium]|nr:SGNH/GDSL hydrolase family protein [Chloroflexota bacterium]